MSSDPAVLTQALSRHRSPSRPIRDSKYDQRAPEEDDAKDGSLRNIGRHAGNGDQPYARRIPLRAGRPVSSGVAVSVRDRGYLSGPSRRCGPALDPVAPRGSVAAPELDGWGVLLRFGLPLPDRRPRQRLHPGVGRVAGAVLGLGRSPGGCKRTRSPGWWLRRAQALAPAARETSQSTKVIEKG